MNPMNLINEIIKEQKKLMPGFYHNIRPMPKPQSNKKLWKLRRQHGTGKRK